VERVQNFSLLLDHKQLELLKQPLHQNFNYLEVEAQTLVK